MNTDLFISDAVVRALGWTLVHSLWQGALAALASLVLLPRLQTAKQKYWAAYGALILVFAAAAVTFRWVFEPAAGSPVAPFFLSGETVPIAQFFTDNQLIETTIRDRLASWLEANYPLIVAVWLLGFGFFLLRLASGLWYVNRLTKTGISAAAGVWEEKMIALGEQLGMSRPVRLLESALVHVPVAIGWLKPVVLLPVGLTNRLSPAEVEAVLAHELAHIARRDWVFNLLQAFIETIFYYHPAVWWLSQVIRRERENCCDDDALAATGNRLAFAKALVQVQEMAKPVPLLALGMSGPRRPLLLERIRRILNQPQQKSQIMEKFTATAILLALLTIVGIRTNNAPSLSAAFAQMTEFPAVLFGEQDDENQTVNDSLPKPKRTRKIIREDDNQRVEAEYQDGKLTRLNIDGKEIPQSEFDQHRALTSELRREFRSPAPPAPPAPPIPGMPGNIWVTPPVPPAPPPPPRLSTAKDDEGNTVIRFERNGEPFEIKVKDGQVWVDDEQLEEGESLDLPGFENGLFFWNDDGENGVLFAPDAFHLKALEEMKALEGLEELGNLERLEELQHLNFSEEDLARMEADAARMREEARQARQEHRQILKEHRRAQKEDRKRLEKELKEHQKEWQKNQKEWQKEQGKWAIEQEKWAKEQAKWALEQARWRKEQARSSAFSGELKAQLQRDGLITDPKNFQFYLSEKELKINGKKQSDELHQKYLEFYRAKTGKDFGKNGSFHWTESN